ncbi:hypothetical protein JCM10914_2854 [Paenibacillus sp. JCM 10914]|nr:hypothetical protein JCM10914_2854 [Paenibacillus sp. JCM 10914]
MLNVGGIRQVDSEDGFGGEDQHQAKYNTYRSVYPSYGVQEGSSLLLFKFRLLTKIYG